MTTCSKPCAHRYAGLELQDAPGGKLARIYCRHCDATLGESLPGMGANGSGHGYWRVPLKLGALGREQLDMGA